MASPVKEGVGGGAPLGGSGLETLLFLLSLTVRFLRRGDNGDFCYRASVEMHSLGVLPVLVEEVLWQLWDPPPQEKTDEQMEDQ